MATRRPTAMRRTVRICLAAGCAARRGHLRPAYACLRDLAGPPGFGPRRCPARPYVRSPHSGRARPGGIFTVSPRSLTPRASAAARCGFGLLPGGRPGRIVTIGIGRPQLTSACSALADSAASLARVAACPVSSARDPASTAWDPASAAWDPASTACGRSAPRRPAQPPARDSAAATSCSAAAFPATASASRASASAAALRACPASASACSARATSPARASSAAAI